MPLLKERYGDLVELLYCAAGNDDLWPDFLTAVSKRFDAPGVAFIFHCPQQQRYEVNVSVGLPEESFRPYAEHFGAKDVWGPGARKLPAGRAELGSVMCSPAVFRRSEFFNDFLKRFRPFVWQCCVSVENKQGVFGALSCLREPGQRDFTKRHLRLLAQLSIQLQQALVIHRRIKDAKAMMLAAADVSERFDTGLILAGGDGTFYLANRTAEQILQAGRFLAIRSGKLICKDHSELQLWADEYARLIQVATEEIAQVEKERAAEDSEVNDTEEKLQHRQGFVPGFNPYGNQLFWGLMGLFGLGETGANYAALQSAGMNVYLTWTMAAFLALVVLLSAHHIARLRVRGESAWAWTVATLAMILLLAKIRQPGIVAFVNDVRSSVPELASVTADPIWYVLLFVGLQCSLFFLSCRVAADHFEPLYAQYHRGKLAQYKSDKKIARLEKAVRRNAAKKAAIEGRMNLYALAFLGRWKEFGSLFEQRIASFMAGFDAYRSTPPVAFCSLQLEPPPVVAWAYERLGVAQPQTAMALPVVAGTR